MEQQYAPIQLFNHEAYNTRSLREKPTRDTINAREYARWNADAPTPILDRPNPSRQAPFYDMMPVDSRTMRGQQFQQAQPYVVDAPPYQNNPYFNKYDITSDPRNVSREVRAAVYEDSGNRGVDESKKIFTRGFDTRYIPMAEQEQERKKALDDYVFLLPKMDNMQKDYRGVSANPQTTR